MRAVSFVDHLELEFPGSVVKNSITLGDVDNDGMHELVVANQNGDLAIFKGTSCRPWRKASDLGMVTAVGIGDIFNTGNNSLVVINGEGWCYIFHISGSSSQINDSDPMKPVHIQRIPANVKVLLLHDVNMDGMIELVIALTDRVVRTYQWANGKLLGLNKWEFASQIGTVTINNMGSGTPSLLVAHPGGTFIRLKCKPLNAVEDQQKEQGELLSKMSIDYHPLASSHMRNPNVSTEILGNIIQNPTKSPDDKGALYAVATLDGTLMLVQDEQILWSIQVDHQLFALSKLDVTRDGREEVVACSWDGQTYIIDQEKQSVRFQFDYAVSAFCAGLFSMKSEAQPQPALAYATFHNKIYLYFNVTLPRISLRTLTDVLENFNESGTDEQNFQLVKQPQMLIDVVTKYLYGDNDFDS